MLSTSKRLAKLYVDEVCRIVIVDVFFKLIINTYLTFQSITIQDSTLKKSVSINWHEASSNYYFSHS